MLICLRSAYVFLCAASFKKKWLRDLGREKNWLIAIHWSIGRIV